MTRTHRQGVRVVVPARALAVELFAIREVLEGLAAREAALRATPDEVAELREMLAGHRASLERPDAMIYWQATANADFHFWSPASPATITCSRCSAASTTPSSGCTACSTG